MEDSVPTDQGLGGGFVMIQKMHYISMHFTTIIIISAPPQIIRHQIAEAGDPGIELIQEQAHHWAFGSQEEDGCVTFPEVLKEVAENAA